MGWKTGFILINQHLGAEEKTFTKGLHLHPSGKPKRLGPLLSPEFQQVGIGYWRQKTILIAPSLAYLSISELDFIPRPPALQFLASASNGFDILCISLHSSAQIWGHSYYQAGKKTENYFRQAAEITQFPPRQYLSEQQQMQPSTYSIETVFEQASRFLGTHFETWLTEAVSLEMNVYVKASVLN